MQAARTLRRPFSLCCFQKLIDALLGMYPHTKRVADRVIISDINLRKEKQQNLASHKHTARPAQKGLRAARRPCCVVQLQLPRWRLRLRLRDLNATSQLSAAALMLPATNRGAREGCCRCRSFPILVRSARERVCLLIARHSSHPLAAIRAEPAIHTPASEQSGCANKPPFTSIALIRYAHRPLLTRPPLLFGSACASVRTDVLRSLHLRCALPLPFPSSRRRPFLLTLSGAGPRGAVRVCVLQGAGVPHGRAVHILRRRQRVRAHRRGAARRHRRPRAAHGPAGHTQPARVARVQQLQGEGGVAGRHGECGRLAARAGDGRHRAAAAEAQVVRAALHTRAGRAGGSQRRAHAVLHSQRHSALPRADTHAGRCCCCCCWQRGQSHVQPYAAASRLASADQVAREGRAQYATRRRRAGRCNQRRVRASIARAEQGDAQESGPARLRAERERGHQWSGGGRSGRQAGKEQSTGLTCSGSGRHAAAQVARGSAGGSRRYCRRCCCPVDGRRWRCSRLHK